MAVETEGLDQIEALLASGEISPDADVTEIAALLAGSDDAPAPDTGKNGATEEDAARAAQAGASTAQAGGEGAAAADDKTRGAATSGSAHEDEPAGPIVTESGRTIPYGVLKGTREQLSRATENLRAEQEARRASEQRAADLERQLAEAKAGAGQTAQVQQLADEAGIRDARGNPIDVANIDVESLRGEFPAAVIDVIAKLQQGLAAQSQELQRLRAREGEREQQAVVSAKEQLQMDIDSVPTLAEWQAAEDPTMFDRAVRFDIALREDPQWVNRPRVERFQEVVRLLGGDVKNPAATGGDKSTSTSTSGTKVSDALARAAARAAPMSHSDLPAGSPAAQSELEGLEKMDITQIAEKMSGMTPEQQNAYLDRFA